ncbi:hypothetical protein BH24ACI3_BH24ACI3_03340 [soil metagenome]
MKKYFLTAVVALFVVIFTTSDSITDARGLNTASVSPHLVISQFQTGGVGVPNDEFIEIFNRGADPIDLNGYRLVYRSATGSTDVTNPLASWNTTTVLPAGGYYLIVASQYSGAAAPDRIYDPNTLQVSLGGGGGGLAIRLGANNTGAIIDSVGWGTATSIFVEGTATAAPGQGNSQSRKTGGCTDSDNNSADFEATIPSSPRNSSTPAAACAGAGTTLFAAMNANPTSVSPGGNTLLTVTVVPATTPPSTNITVAANLESIGGASSQPFFDDGTNGDQTPGDNVFSYLAQVAPSTPGGLAPIVGAAVDMQGRVATVQVTLTIDAPLPNDDPLIFGNPSNATPDIANENNYLMQKPQYSLSYNRSRATANWVAWRLDSSWIGSTQRQDDFRPDPALPDGWYRVESFDYSGSGFDRGHMCPSGDRTNSVLNNSATFLMTNIVPQLSANNQGPWEKFESYSRTLAAEGKEVYIFSGVHGNAGTISNGRIVVPAVTWKVALVLPSGSNDLQRANKATRVVGIIVPNQGPVDINAPWRNFRVTVDAVENLTGYDFFSNIPINTQAIIERRRDKE